MKTFPDFLKQVHNITAHLSDKFTIIALVFNQAHETNRKAPKIHIDSDHQFDQNN